MKLLGLLMLLLLSTTLHSQSKIFLENGSTIPYSEIKANGKKSDATILSNNENMSLAKKDILSFTNSNGALYTFHLKSGRKLKVKEKGSIDEPCYKAKIHAYKYFKYKGATTNPYADASSKKDYASCFEEQTKKLRTRSTVGAVSGGVAFALGLSLFISSVSQASSL
ncbi:MAG: hypothetical protein ACR2MX_08945 [Cyclobacteriaceae bacterium]